MTYPSSSGGSDSGAPSSRDAAPASEMEDFAGYMIEQMKDRESYTIEELEDCPDHVIVKNETEDSKDQVIEKKETEDYEVDISEEKAKLCSRFAPGIAYFKAFYYEQVDRSKNRLEKVEFGRYRDDPFGYMVKIWARFKEEATSDGTMIDIMPKSLIKKLKLEAEKKNDNSIIAKKTREYYSDTEEAIEKFLAEEGFKRESNDGFVQVWVRGEA